MQCIIRQGGCSNYCVARFLLTEPEIGRIVLTDPESRGPRAKTGHITLRTILSENRFPSPIGVEDKLFGIMREGGCHERQGDSGRQVGSLGGDIFSVEPTADLAAAAKLLAAHRIGALVIRGAGGRLAGILSERDIVRALAERGAEALALPVGQVMTREVETCGENDSVASLMERMTTGKFRHMPVVEQGRLVGLISIGDVVKQRVEEFERESEAMRDYIRTA